MKYEPTFESISRHPVPDWYHDAKLGIFIHWGLYSVPGWAPPSGELSEAVATGEWSKWFANNPYAEWYMNSIRIEGSPSHRYHIETYGPNFAYRDFVPMFNQAIEKWNPAEWADLFAQVGARYAVLTTKHHDGFLLWPSERPNPFREGYHAQRDLVGELTTAVRERGMRMGLYYSGGLDWTFNDTVIRDVTDIPVAVPQSREYVEYADAHWYELIARYRPSILWNDIAYPAAADLYALFAHYYNTVPDGVINDRFTQSFEFSEGQVGGSHHYDFRTPEYASMSEITDFKWESTRGIGFSFGYNRNEGPEHYLSVQDLVHSFVDIVSKNGNLLLNVGPMADGTIPELQRERLEGLGRWLAINGEAIYATRPWTRAEGNTDDGLAVRFTQKGDSLYAIVLGCPQDNCKIVGLKAREGTTIRLLGNPRPHEWHNDEGALFIALPEQPSATPACTFAITPQPYDLMR